MQRRIWAKKGGAAERPFDDSGVFNSVSVAAPSRQQSGEIGGAPKTTGDAEIVDLPPNVTPPPRVSPLRQPPTPKAPPPREDEGPVVVLAPPRPASVPQRPVAEPQTPQSQRPPTRSTPARVQIAAPSADGVVISRPSSVVVSGSVQSGAPSRPVPPVAQPPVARPSSQHAPVAAAGTPSTGKTGKPPSAPREAPADSIFGEDLISEKSLDEVILAYLAEDAKHPK
jgi:hypothetical protein